MYAFTVSPSGAVRANSTPSACRLSTTTEPVRNAAGVKCSAGSGTSAGVSYAKRAAENTGKKACGAGAPSVTTERTLGEASPDGRSTTAAVPSRIVKVTGTRSDPSRRPPSRRVVGRGIEPEDLIDAPADLDTVPARLPLVAAHRVEPHHRGIERTQEDRSSLRRVVSDASEARTTAASNGRTNGATANEQQYTRMLAGSENTRMLAKRPEFMWKHIAFRDPLAGRALERALERLEDEQAYRRKNARAGPPATPMSRSARYRAAAWPAGRRSVGDGRPDGRPVPPWDEAPDWHCNGRVVSQNTNPVGIPKMRPTGSPELKQRHREVVGRRPAGCEQVNDPNRRVAGIADLIAVRNRESASRCRRVQTVSMGIATCPAPRNGGRPQGDRIRDRNTTTARSGRTSPEPRLERSAEDPRELRLEWKTKTGQTWDGTWDGGGTGP